MRDHDGRPLIAYGPAETRYGARIKTRPAEDP
jgi:hypothetical protein